VTANNSVAFSLSYIPIRPTAAAAALLVLTLMQWDEDKNR